MVDVILVTSPTCHFCEDAQEALAELAGDYPLSVREIPLETEQGRELFERFHPPMPPFVIIDDELFSAGRLPRKKLRKHLDRVGAVA